jgi:hypothetical protein
MALLDFSLFLYLVPFPSDMNTVSITEPATVEIHRETVLEYLDVSVDPELAHTLRLIILINQILL